MPGDILYITPKNFAADVNTLISLMKWEEDADVPLRFIPRDSSASTPPPPIPFLLDHPGFTLRDLLTDYLDIMAIPRRSFFSQIAHFTDDPMHKERLLEFTIPEYIDEFYDYATRARRSILEVLHEFDSVKIPWQQACNIFPVIRGRQFSIASGGNLKKTSDEKTRVDLLVAIVKYRTVIKKIRQGVCTRYIATLQPGSTLKVSVQRGGLNPTAKQLMEPSVLIGPGTGVAPIRSLLWEKAAILEASREADGAAPGGRMGPVVLLYGGRNRAADFFFEKEWEELSRILDLTVLTAFSRDQKNKIYVQDVLSRNSGLFLRMLHEMKGMVFICGSSGRMPRAVREALIETFQGAEGNPETSRQTAEKYLLEMERVGRYRQETW
jgi:sulfite reductase alpha subunit-like flavoprotein